MKNLSKFNLSGLVIVLITALGGYSAKASHIDSLTLSGTKVENLALDQPEIEVNLLYPGPSVSGLCGVEIRADSNGRQLGSILKLRDAIEIETDLESAPISIKNRLTISIDLAAALGRFITTVTIRSKDGTNLDKTIEKALGKPRTIVLAGVSCP